MSGEFPDWSKIAANNATADATINFSEGMSPSAVNDSCRALMAAVASYRDDMSGALATTGTATAYVVTTNQSIAATPNAGQRLVIRPNATSGAAPTLAADGGTAWPIQSSPGVAVATGTLVSGAPYAVTFITNAWLLNDYFAITLNLDQFGSTRGMILERAAGGWAGTAPGSIGTVWTSGGTGADPSYQAPATIAPQGCLTPTSLTPVITGDVVGASTIYYTPDSGAYVPIYNGTNFINAAFAELSIALSSGSQALGGIYDVFIFLNSGVVTAAFGPSWAAGGGSVAAGSCARGTGAGSTELQRVGGLLTNKNAISAANNGATTYAVSANQGAYVGSVYISTTAGQVTCHRNYGQNRQWNIFNAPVSARRPIILRAGDPTASWDTSSATVGPSNGDANNKITTFAGLAEEWYDLAFAQKSGAASGNPNNYTAIGYNSTTTSSGMAAINNGSSSLIAQPARYLVPPTMGIHVITALAANTPSVGVSRFYGTETNMLLSAMWRG